MAAVACDGVKNSLAYMYKQLSLSKNKSKTSQHVENSTLNERKSDGGVSQAMLKTGLSFSLSSLLSPISLKCLQLWSLSSTHGSMAFSLSSAHYNVM